jgi:nanoRNase/pAp phosphatase (c-di-AMP/oligoRNAs hydrolase)
MCLQKRWQNVFTPEFLTDTASFSNGATSKKALEIAAHLLDCGLNIINVQEQLNQNGQRREITIH